MASLSLKNGINKLTFLKGMNYDSIGTPLQGLYVWDAIDDLGNEIPLGTLILDKPDISVLDEGVYTLQFTLSDQNPNVASPVTIDISVEIVDDIGLGFIIGKVDRYNNDIFDTAIDSLSITISLIPYMKEVFKRDPDDIKFKFLYDIIKKTLNKSTAIVDESALDPYEYYTTKQLLDKKYN